MDIHFEGDLTYQEANHLWKSFEVLEKRKRGVTTLELWVLLLLLGLVILSIGVIGSIRTGQLSSFWLIVGVMITAVGVGLRLAQARSMSRGGGQSVHYNGSISDEHIQLIVEGRITRHSWDQFSRYLMIEKAVLLIHRGKPKLILLTNFFEEFDWEEALALIKSKVKEYRPDAEVVSAGIPTFENGYSQEKKAVSKYQWPAIIGFVIILTVLILVFRYYTFK